MLASRNGLPANARLIYFWRSFGLPTARAPAHNLFGQQGLKISIPCIDRLAGGSVQRRLSAAGGDG
jgi:hypothetical protein